ncbi:MAG: CHAD domain-containing protein [Acidimicrobiia bacterium]
MRDLASRAIGDLDDLISGLRTPIDLDETIHATRTGIKWLRAFVRLARVSIGTDTYRIENGSLRDAARLIAPARDARVLIDTAASEDAAPTVVAVLEGAHADAIDALENGVRMETVRLLESTAGRWNRLAWSGPPVSSIRIGLKKTYRRGRTDYATVLAEPTAEAFHGWRRGVKYLRYQLQAIKAPNRFVAPYTDLGDHLGLEHDHTVLIGACCSFPGDADFADLARRSMAQRAELRSLALDLGSRLFVAHPDHFVDIVEETVNFS